MAFGKLINNYSQGLKTLHQEGRLLQETMPTNLRGRHSIKIVINFNGILHCY